MEEKNATVAALEAIESKLMDHIKGHEEKLALQMKELQDKNGEETELVKKLEEQKKEHEENIKNLGLRIDQLKAELNREPVEVDREVKTVGELFAENEDFQNDLRHAFTAAQESGDRNLPMKRDFRKVYNYKNFFPLGKALLFKTDITSSTVGSSTPGILVPQRIRDFVPAAERRLTIRDLFNAFPTDANKVEFPKRNAFTNAASPQTEASAKAESALTFTIGSAPVSTIAHWIPASRQVLDDWAALGRVINSELMYGLKLKEETEMLSGDGLGSHLTGLTTAATAYAATYLAANDQQLDTLAHAMLELEVAEETGANFIVLNPVDLHNIMLLKTEDSGTANTGAYLLDLLTGRPYPVPTVWNLPVVKTNSMTSGKFLVGNSAMAEVRDRMQANIAISTEYSTYFVENMVAIRAEERVAFPIFRSGAFVYGSF